MEQREIIDIHMHPFTSQATRGGTYDMGSTLDDVVNDIKRAGITQMAGSVLCGFSRPTLEYMKWLNDTAFQIKEQLGDFYIPGIHVSPLYPKESMEILDTYHKQGGVLIGEVKALGAGWEKYSDPAWDCLFDLMAEYDMFLSIHPTDDLDMERLCMKHKDLKIMLAHPGEYERYHSYLDKIKRYENVYMDITGVGLFRYGMLWDGVKAVGSERILFGTDYPVCNPIMQVAGVDYEKISDKDKENIFSANAKRVLKL